MNDVVVTWLWMAGVMLIMLAYGVIAVIGFLRRAAKSPPTRAAKSPLTRG